MNTVPRRPRRVLCKLGGSCVVGDTRGLLLSVTSVGFPVETDSCWACGSSRGAREGKCCGQVPLPCDARSDPEAQASCRRGLCAEGKGAAVRTGGRLPVDGLGVQDGNECLVRRGAGPMLPS